MNRLADESEPLILEGVNEEREGGAPQPLRACVNAALTRYFEHLDGETPQGLYALVMREVEAPLLEVVMRHLGGNQTRAAQALGMSRSTLRKKLRDYGLD